MLIVFHCRQTFIKDADGKPYILIVFAPISGFILLSRISFPIIFQHFKMLPETSIPTGAPPGSDQAHMNVSACRRRAKSSLEQCWRDVAMSSCLANIHEEIQIFGNLSITLKWLHDMFLGISFPGSSAAQQNNRSRTHDTQQSVPMDPIPHKQNLVVAVTARLCFLRPLTIWR